MSFPVKSAAAVVVLAAAVFAAGAALSRRVEIVPRTADASALEEIAADIDGELDWLEDVYEGHLLRIARVAESEDAFEIRREAGNIIGIEQVSLLRAAGGSRDDVHVRIDSRTTEAPVVPALAEPDEAGASAVIVLDPRDFAADGPEWIRTPEGLNFFRVPAADPRTEILIQASMPDVQDAASGWVKDSGALSGTGRELADAVRLAGPRGAAIAETGAAADVSRPADRVISIFSGLGTWKLAAWTPRDTVVSYHLPTLLGGAVLSGAIVLLGGLLVIRHHRAVALAERQVSFANRVSHELRTPITNILLNTDIIADEIAEAAPRARRRLDLVRDESRRLGRLIDNVLAFSAARRGQEKPVRLAAYVPDTVVAAVLDQFAPLLDRRGIAVTLDRGAAESVMTDPDAIAQIIGNLVSNVEKYAASGQSMLVATSWSDGRLSVAVEDAGPGVPAKHRAQIFQPFERVSDAVTEGATGTGLGLSIARDLAERLGGSLALDSGCDDGARFVLEVPAAAASREHAAVPRASS